MIDAEVQKRASRIKLLLMDCDGVLTDGRLWILEENDDQKSFHSRDGFGIELLHRAGLKSGVISGRNSTSLARRAHWLGMSYVRQGSEEKLDAFAEILAEAGVESSQVAFIGDDLNDIPLMLKSGLGIAVSDAARETCEHAHYVTEAPGGLGAVREVVELILKAQGRWDELLRHYLG
jgi:3-deoxy-D-manno-octulosonate 8-phosphate phosphatase (KDO 8-P phosphatase)